VLEHSTPKCCYSIIYSTDSLWLKKVKKLDSDIVNFWSPSDKELYFTSDNFFFKTIDKTIAGYATLKKIEIMTAEEAWNKFGELNGAESEDEFLHMIPATKDKKIKCIILENPVFFETPLKLADCGIPTWRFSDKYLDEWETKIIWSQVREFDPVDNDTVDETRLEKEVHGKINQPSIIEGRPYQNRLKQELIKIYGGKCAICDMDVQQLLRASHIIPHSKNKKTAKRLDNAILLCSLHDSLFDNGLITITHNNGTYRIEISGILRESRSNAAKKLCEDLAKAKFREPTRSPPSDESLKYHNSKIFEK